MTTNPTEELLPCPFCGGEAKILWFNATMMHDDKFYYPRCTNCGSGFKNFRNKTVEEAVKKWNTRAALPMGDGATGNAALGLEQPSLASPTQPSSLVEALEKLKLSSTSYKSAKRKWFNNVIAIVRQFYTEEKVLTAMNAPSIPVPSDKEGYFNWLEAAALPRVDDEMVKRVADAINDADYGLQIPTKVYRERLAKAAIAALTTPTQKGE